MATAKLKDYRIQKRFELWVGKVVKAATFEDALAIARASTCGDFLTIDEDVELIDSEILTGTQVGEEWE